jgi:hypothetical protein
MPTSTRGSRKNFPCSPSTFKAVPQIRDVVHSPSCASMLSVVCLSSLSFRFPIEGYFFRYLLSHSCYGGITVHLTLLNRNQTRDGTIVAELPDVLMVRDLSSKKTTPSLLPTLPTLLLSLRHNSSEFFLM